MANNPYLEMVEQGQSVNAETGGNPYLEMAEAGVARDNSAFKASATLALEANPDEVARQKRIADLLQVPPAAVEAMPNETSQQARLLEIEKATQGAPALRQQFTREDFARLAHDDVENLAGIERTITGTLRDIGVTALKGAVGLPQAALGLLSITDGGRTARALERGGVRFNDSQEILAKTFSPAQQAANTKVQNAEGFLDTLATAIQNPSTILVSVGESAPQMLAGGAVSRGILAVAPRVGVLGAAAAGEGIVGAGAAAEQMRANNADGLLTGKERVAAVGAGAGTALASLVGGKLARKLGVGDIDTAIASGKLTREGVKQSLVKELRDAGLSEGVFEELPQSMQEQVWQNFAEDKPLLEGVGNAGAMGLLAGSVTGMGFQGVQHFAMRDAQRVDAAGKAAAGVEELNRLAAASKTLKRDATTVEQFLQSAVAEGADSLYIGGRELMQTGVGEAVARLSPSAAQQIEEALATGGQVRIPLSEYTARIAGTEYAQQLVDHLKVDPSGFSRAEAREYLQTQGEQLKTEVEQVLAEKNVNEEFRASQDALKQQVMANLNEAGRFDERTNEVYAELITARTAVRAARLGMTPEQLFAKDLQNLQVRAEQVGGARVLNQEGAFAAEGSTDFNAGKAQAAEMFGTFGDYAYDGKTLTSNGERVADLKLRVDGNRLVIDNIEAARKGEGAGTAAISAITAHAQQNGLVPVLTTDAMRGKKHQQRLRKYYARLGFVANKGANKIKGISEEFYLPPRELNQSGRVAQFTTGLTEALKRSTESDGAFRSRRSAASDLVGVMADIAPDFTASATPLLAHKAKQKTPGFTIYNADGKAYAHVYNADSATPYIDIGDEDGTRQAGGMAVYQAIGQWAKNTGKIIIPDPRGLSEVNWLRRSEAMISATLHQRDSDIFAPDLTQFAGLLDEADYRKLVNNQHQKEVIPEVIEKLEGFKRDLWDDASGHGFSKEETYSIRVNNLAIASAILAVKREPKLGKMGVDSNAILHVQVGGQDQAIAVGEGTEAKAFADVVGGADRVQASGVGYSTAQRALIAGQFLGWKPGSGVERFVQLGLQSLAGAESVRSGDRAPRGSLGAFGQSRLAESLNSAGLFYQSVYHGTPYKFDRFSLEHMGKGEGAQAYGWGLYLAGKREIAEHYRQVLTRADGQGPVRQDNTSMIPRQVDASVADIVSRLDREILVAETNLQSTQDNPDAFEPGYAEKLQRTLENLRARREQANRNGQLYEASIPDEGYLLWDKPLSEQPAAVREALGKAAQESGATMADALRGKSVKELISWALSIDPNSSWDEVLLETPNITPEEMAAMLAESYGGEETDSYLGAESFGNNQTGDSIYRQLSAKLGSDEAASRFLNNLGINGIQFLDGTSRRQNLEQIEAKVRLAEKHLGIAQKAGDADRVATWEAKLQEAKQELDDVSYNYVIFDDAAIEIVNTYYQNEGVQARGSFNPDTTVMTLLKNADLSTVLHELGHYFFEADIALASELVADGRTFGEGTHTEGERQLLQDVQALLNWHGIPGTIEEQLRQWHTMDFEEKRVHHERTAESFEAYLFEGNAPSIELQPYFQKFRSWLTRVYKSLKDFLSTRPEAGKLDDTVRAVFDRMLATDEQIALAQQGRSMQAMFRTEADATAAGMTPEEFATYQGLGEQAAADAQQDLQARALRDLQWTRNARAKEIKKLQRKSAEIRRDVRMAVRREVMSQPVYRAWQFLTSKITADDKITADALPKSEKNAVTPEVDSLFVAIAKLGGLAKDDVANTWGVTDAVKSGVFGKPVLRVTGGYTVDAMGEKLGELGYLTLDRNGKIDVREFEELFGDELRGSKRYSNQVDGRVLRADQAMPGEGIDPNAVQAGRLAADSLEAMGLPAEIIGHLEAMRMVAKTGGWHPDLIAERFGFDSGDELVRTLAAAEAPQVEIEGLTDARMFSEFGELATPAAIEREADKAIHNEARARMIATEANALAKATGQRKVLVEAAKAYADAMIARLKVRDVRPGQYAAAATKAGKLAEKALREGNLPTAAAEKRNQLVNTLAAKAAMEAQAETEGTVKKWAEFARRADDKLVKSYDMDMVNAVRAILGQYGIAEKRAKKAVEYLRAVEAYDPEMYGMLRQSVDAAEASAKPFRDMTVEEVRGLRDEIDAILHLARRSREMEVGGDRLDRKDVEDVLHEQLEQIGIPGRVPGEGMAVTPAEAAMSKFKAFVAAATRMENWTERMDAGKPMGPFKRFVYSVIKDAADAYRTDKAAKLKEFRTLVESIAPSLKPQVIAAPELGYTFGKDSGGSAINEMLHALLHTGNESNKRKLLLGRGWATEGVDGVVDTSRWDAFVARMVAEGKLTPEHFDFVQGVWDLLESTKPLAQKTHRDVFGKYFDEVTAQEFVDPFGITRRGGYVPAMVDTRVVKEGELRALAEMDNASMAYAFPTTAKGFTKSRVDYNRPLMLDLRTLAQHIDKVLLFSHMEMPVRDVQRVLSGKVGSGINRIDPAATTGLIVPWLNRAAKQQVEAPIAGSAGLMRFFSVARSRAGMAAMFGNLANAVQQVTGFSMAAVKVKPGLLTEAMAQYMKDPKGLTQAVRDASPYMAGRMENEVAVMADAINDILLNPTLLEKGQAWTMRHAYFLQSGIDNVMSPVIWTAAYNQYMQQNYGHDDAARLADGVVRTTQGSTMPEDISRIEGGNAFVRLFTQFAGYFNMQANLLGTEFVNVARELGLRKGAGRGLYVLTMGFLIPAVVGEAIMQLFRGGPDDEDGDGYVDDWLAALFGWAPLRNATAMVPGVGQGINASVNAWNDKPYDDRVALSPAVSMLEVAFRAPATFSGALNGDGSPQKAVRDVATLISMTVGLPANLAARPVGYAAGVAAGDINPTGPVDAVRGTITGTASAASK